jgi:hypothetical protein
MIIKNASVRSEKVVIIVSRDGTSKQKLAVATNLGAEHPDMEVLIAELEEFLRDNSAFDTAEIISAETRG